MNESRLEQRIRAAMAKGRKALIPFLPAGYPDLERFWDELAALDAGGADIIEIGVPFSDPVADGPVVERASLHCLELGVSLAWIIAELKKRRASIGAEIVLMGYMNPFLQYGFERLAADAADAGVAGLIIPDLPYEEAMDVKRTLGARGIDLVYLVGLNTEGERLAMYAADAAGFAYFVSVLGTTGVRETLPEEITAKLAAAKKTFRVPLALGFGIKTPEQLAAYGDDLDAVVFGSALIRHIEEGGTAAEFMRRWA
ncbi:MAG: tryptophan synthase subunit alpha [Desulfovibrionaceae bacterium]|jgi:tryptophan synthase alpha chain|nr:tryptophan synthase subunit alpha [Desulfovibrionaceae bacterium]